MIFSTKLHCNLKHILLESKMGGHGLITYASTSCHGETTPCPQVEKFNWISLCLLWIFYSSALVIVNCLLKGSCLNYNLERYPCFLENMDIGGPEASLVHWIYSASRQVSFLWVLFIFQRREQCRDYCSGFSSADSFVWTKPEEAPENQICFCKVTNIFSQLEKHPDATDMSVPLLDA